ncbi:MAG TPA: alpha-2-macroglobulin family protein, partial [Tepidiformaceae bacterium]|nr:alpha-2-macroglobulin family protein [Tepidiformaceae bacterium]
RKPEFQVEVAAGHGSYANGDTIDSTATASFFFGGALAGAKTEWSVLASPYYVRMKGYEAYTFGETQRWRYGPESVIRDPVRASGTAVTNAGGVASFGVPAVLKGDEGAQQFTLAATVTDQSAQAVANSTTVTVHPASLYAGVKTNAYIGFAGEASRADVVTVDTEGRPQPNRAVRVLVYDRKWVTTKESTPDGARRYRSDPVDTLIETLSVTTDAKGLGSVSFTPKTTGTIRLVAEITDDRGRTARSATYLWVAGAGEASWRISNDDIIQLVADKERYEIGETAQVLVPTPFEGATGLVTVERGKILTREVRDFPTTSTTISIPITAKSVPNVFVSTVLYRPPTATDPVPRYKVGYVELPVSTATRALNVEVKSDRDQAKPGDTVRYTVRVTDSAGKGVRAEVSAAVVDKAVLSLAEDRSQTGLAAFWFERGLGVTTTSSMAVSLNRSNDVISEPRQGGKGGGGLEDDRLRQEFKNTAFWAPQLVTKDDGTLTVDVKLPDNLTTWRFQARAVSGDTLVGEGTNELMSTQPLLLRPALPRFLRVGDAVKLRLLVRNATKDASDVTVTLKAEGVDVTGDLSHKARIAAGESAVMEWPANVTAEGTAKLTFTAKGSGGLSDAVVQEVPIALDVTPETMATGGVVATESMTEAIYLPAYAILKGGSLNVSVQGTLVGSLSTELAAFAPFPVRWHEPSERIAGRIVATIGVARSEKSQGIDASGRMSTVASDVARLLARQRQDGGWAWCEAPACESVPQVTASVLLALGEANREGVTVSDDQIGRAASYVGAYITRSVDLQKPADASEKAYMLYAIAAGRGAGEVYLSTMRALQDGYRAKLANWGRAYLLLAYKEAGVAKDDRYVSQLLNDLTAGMVPSATGNHWEDEGAKGAYMTTTRATALALNALVRVDPGHPLIEETVRWLMNARSTGGWETDIERAQAILALSEFAAGTGELRGDFTFRALLDAREILTGRVQPGAAPTPLQKQVPLTELGAGKVTMFELAREATEFGRLYYTLALRYMTPAQGIESLNRGFAISREYSLLDGDGSRISKAKLGDTVRVKVTVMLPEDHTFVVAEDFLPAGLEPIDPQLKTTDPKLIALLEKERAETRPEKVSYWAPWFHWYYNPWQQVDTRDDRVTLRATRLEKGVYEYIYYARATTPGDYFVAPAHVQDSYFPDLFGRSDSGRFVVEP